MSGAPRPSASEIKTVQDAQREINFVEGLLDGLSADDEYLEAILHNQRLRLMILMNQGGLAGSSSLTPSAAIERGNDILDDYESVTDKDPVPLNRLFANRNMPVGAVGIAAESISENDTGVASFQLRGSVVAARVRAEQDTDSGAPVRVIAPGNIVEPQGAVARSLLGFDGSLNAGAFEVTETDRNNPVEIEPGEEKEVLSLGLRGGDILKIGTVSRTYSLYNYEIDGEEVLEEPLSQPLGVFNDPFRFPQPLSIDRSFKVKIKRTSDASGAETYFSKAVYFQ